MGLDVKLISEKNKRVKIELIKKLKLNYILAKSDFFFFFI
jgi:hypothetical protein